MQRRRNLHKSRNFNHPRVANMECIGMVISLRFSLNNMRTALRCNLIECFHQFMRNVNEKRITISKSTKFRIL